MAYKLPLNSAEAFTLVTLANHADETGQCFPSYQLLMRKTKLAKATLAKALFVLEHGGLIEKFAHGSVGTGRKVNTYRLIFDESWFEKSTISSRTELIESIRVELIYKINNLRKQKPSR